MRKLAAILICFFALIIHYTPQGEIRYAGAKVTKMETNRVIFIYPLGNGKWQNVTLYGTIAVLTDYNNFVVVE